MYNKLFTKILDSSIWLESMPTRIVWLTIIAAMDEHGFAQFASVANIAHRARVTAEEAEAAMACLEGPDENSSDQDNEGRRLDRVPGGWVVLNAQKHRDMVTRAVQQEQTRERVRRFRERVKRGGNENVTPSEAESQADTDPKAKEEARSSSSVNGQGSTLIPKGGYARRQVNNPFVSDRFDVPTALHRKFCDRYGSGADAVLLAWYQTVLDSLGADESLPADIFAWLPARFDAWLVTTGRVKSVRKMAPGVVPITDEREANMERGRAYTAQRQAERDAREAARGQR